MTKIATLLLVLCAVGRSCSDWWLMVAVGCAILRRQRQNPLPGFEPRKHSKRTTRVACFFVCSPVVPAISVMTGWAGQPMAGRFPWMPGSSNPVQLVTRSRFEPRWWRLTSIASEESHHGQHHQPYPCRDHQPASRRPVTTSLKVAEVLANSTKMCCARSNSSIVHLNSRQRIFALTWKINRLV